MLWGAGEEAGETYCAKLGAPHRKNTSGSRPSGTGRRPSPSPAAPPAPQPRCRPSPRRQLRGEPLKSAGQTPREPGTETSAELRADTALGGARRPLPARLGACLTAPHACPRPSRIAPAPVPVPVPPLPGCGADTAAWPGPATLPAPGLQLRPGTGRWRLPQRGQGSPQRVAGAQGAPRGAGEDGGDRGEGGLSVR